MFLDYVLALTSLAKRADSPAYAELREILLALRGRGEARLAFAPWDAEYVKDTFGSLVRLVFECRVDMDVAAFGKEVRHG